MTKIIRRTAIVGATVFLGICSTPKAQAQAINTTQDFQLYCTKEAYYYNMQSSDCDRVIQESWGSQGIHSLEQYLQIKQKQEWQQHAMLLIEDAKDAAADERFGVAQGLFEDAAEAFANAGENEASREANRMAIQIGRACQNLNLSMASSVADQAYYGTTAGGVVDTFLGISRIDRACRKS